MTLALGVIRVHVSISVSVSERRERCSNTAQSAATYTRGSVETARHTLITPEGDSGVAVLEVVVVWLW